MHQAFNLAPEALQLHKAAKVHDAADLASVDPSLLRLIKQGGWRGAVASRTFLVPASARQKETIQQQTPQDARVVLETSYMARLCQESRGVQSLMRSTAKSSTICCYLA